MNILYIMIPLAIVLVIMAIFFFFWAVNNKQFDDLDSPAYRILLDDEHDAVMQQPKIPHVADTDQPPQNN